MKELFEKIRADIIISSVCYIVFGVILVARPIKTIDLFCRILAIALIVIGVAFMISFVLNWVTEGISAAIGLFIVIVGIWILVKPATIEVLIPIVIGIILLFHALNNLKVALNNKKANVSNWGVELIISLISLVLGCVCILDSFVLIKGAMIILGISLIYTGVSNLVIIARTDKATKDYIDKSQAIDADYEEK